MTRRRVASGLIAMALVALVPQATAAEPVVVDPSGDATPDRCTLVLCTSVATGASQPAADILAVDVVPRGSVFGAEVTFLDIDRAIPKRLDAEDGFIWTSVSFRLGSPRDNRWAAVWLSATRDFSGALTSSAAEVGVGTHGGNDKEINRWLAGTATIDRASNRLRLAVSLDALQRAVEEMCPGCGSLAPGSKLWGFFAQSRAGRVYSAGVPLTGVGESVAEDTGWPDDRSYTM